MIKILEKLKKVEFKFTTQKIEIQVLINKHLTLIKTKNQMKNNNKNFSVQDSKNKCKIYIMVQD